MASVTKLVGAATELAYNSAGVAWTDLSNVTAEDANFAYCTTGANARTKYLVATMSGNEFAIPTGARIDGVEVQVRADTADGSGTVFYLRSARLVIGDQITGLDYFPTSVTFGPTAATYTFGGATENWGITQQIAGVNAGGFGFAIYMQRQGTTSRTLRVYWIKITVHYTADVGTAYRSSDAGICVASVPTDSDVLTTFRFMFPGLGAVKAALFYIPVLNQSHMTNGLDAEMLRDNLTLFLAGAQSTTQYAAQTGITDGSFAVARQAFSDRLATLIGTQLFISGFGTDYVEVSFTEGGADHTMVCVAFGGADLQVASGVQAGVDAPTSPTVDITSCEFEPDLVAFVSGLEIPGSSHPRYGGWDVGWAHNAAGGVEEVQCNIEQRFRPPEPDAGDLTDNENMGRVGNDYAHWQRNWGEDEIYWWNISDFDADGFTITEGSGLNASADDGALWIALKFGADTAIKVGELSMPTSTGSQSLGLPSFSFTPTFFWAAMTLLTAHDTPTYDSSEGDSFAVCAMRDNIVASAGATCQNATNPANVRHWIARSSMLLLAGDQTDAFDANAPVFSEGDVSMTFATANGTARKGIFLALGDAPAGGTVAKILQQM